MYEVEDETIRTRVSVLFEVRNVFKCCYGDLMPFKLLVQPEVAQWSSHRMDGMQYSGHLSSTEIFSATSHFVALFIVGLKGKPYQVRLISYLFVGSSRGQR
jgi:hypothetical protein